MSSSRLKMPVVGFVLLFVTGVLSSVMVVADDTRLSVPSKAELKLKSSAVAEIYKAQFDNARKSTDKIELAKKMIADGKNTFDDPIGRFVLLRIARDIAAQQGDLSTTLEAIELIDNHYAVDRGEMQLEAATITVNNLSNKAERLNAIVLLEPLIDAAITADKFDQATALTNLAAKCAKTSRELKSVNYLANRLLEIEEIEKRFKKVKQAKEILLDNPTDPSSNLVMGEFFCFAKGDWKKGSPLLALGSDEELKTAALLELEPKPDAMKLGEAWFAISKKLSGFAQARAKSHAGEWYQRALPSLRGLTKRKVEAQLVELTDQSANPLKSYSFTEISALEALEKAIGESLWKIDFQKVPLKSNGAADIFGPGGRWEMEASDTISIYDKAGKFRVRLVFSEDFQSAKASWASGRKCTAKRLK